MLSVLISRRLLRLILLIRLAFSVSTKTVILEFNLWGLGPETFRGLFIVDMVSGLFTRTVLLITLAVLAFRSRYIKLSKFNTKFHLTLTSFVVSIVILILSPHPLRVLVGWDGLGISSYMLVVFYRSKNSLGAGLITGIINRVGDRIILISLFRLASRPSGRRVFVGSYGVEICWWVWRFFILAGITKRAQVPFRAWLPAAIAAPTPVSALVHSSTLVTAGVYLVLRFMTGVLNKFRLLILAALGVVTILLARLRALIECDIKKIVALSTLSQLGVMFRGFASTLRRLVLFHLVVHAFFKALLFIRAGHLIHNMQDYQDLRRIGNARMANPLSGSIVCLTKASLCGLPFYSSFYSKEFILEGLTTRRGLTIFVYLGMWLGVLLTLAYSGRFISLVLRRGRRTSRLFSKQEQDGRVVLSIGLLLLPRVSAGKFLHTYLAPFLGVSLESRGSKASVLLILITGLILAVGTLSSRAQVTNKSYIWRLPFWTGGLRNRAIGRGGYRLRWLGRFSVVDLLLIAWLNQTSGKRLLFQVPRQAFFRLGVSSTAPG